MIRIAARPGTTRAGVLGQVGDALKVGVHAAPERGKANKELIEVLAAALQLKRSQLELVAGETSRDKSVRVTGLSEAALRARLDALTGS